MAAKEEPREVPGLPEASSLPLETAETPTTSQPSVQKVVDEKPVSLSEALSDDDDSLPKESVESLAFACKEEREALPARDAKTEVADAAVKSEEPKQGETDVKSEPSADFSLSKENLASLRENFFAPSNDRLDVGDANTQSPAKLPPSHLESENAEEVAKSSETSPEKRSDETSSVKEKKKSSDRKHHRHHHHRSQKRNFRVQVQSANK